MSCVAEALTQNKGFSVVHKIEESKSWEQFRKKLKDHGYRNESNLSQYEPYKKYLSFYTHHTQPQIMIALPKDENTIISYASNYKLTMYITRAALNTSEPGQTFIPIEYEDFYLAQSLLGNLMDQHLSTYDQMKTVFLNAGWKPVPPKNYVENPDPSQIELFHSFTNRTIELSSHETLDWIEINNLINLLQSKYWYRSPSIFVQNNNRIKSQFEELAQEVKKLTSLEDIIAAFENKKWVLTTGEEKVANKLELKYRTPKDPTDPNDSLTRKYLILTEPISQSRLMIGLNPDGTLPTISKALRNSLVDGLKKYVLVPIHMQNVLHTVQQNFLQRVRDAR